MLRKSELWMGLGLFLGAFGVSAIVVSPRLVFLTMIFFVTAIGCFLASGVHREREKEVSNTRREREWDRYE